MIGSSIPTYLSKSYKLNKTQMHNNLLFIFVDFDFILFI